MVDLLQQLAEMETDPAVRLRAPAGQPRIAVPPDLALFHTRCGGATLFADSIRPIDIVAPSGLVPASTRHVGAHPLGDRSDDWFELVFDGPDLAVVIDLHPDRIGRCYDGSSDGYGLRGSMPVVATSFTDLLDRLRSNTDPTRLYWTLPSWQPLGDAYD